MNFESFEPLFAARTYAYTVFHVLLGDYPTPERMQALDVELLSEAFNAVGVQAPGALLDVLQDAKKGTDLHGQYMRCFVGPQKLPAAPWEAANRTGEDALFQEITLQVRKAYRAVGFIPSLYPHVADDHIALELDFLRVLSMKAAEAIEAGDVGTCTRCIWESAGFLNEHVNVWVEGFAARLSASGVSHFYGVVTDGVVRFCRADADGLAEVLSENPNLG